jgi:hypothetical protein
VLCCALYHQFSPGTSAGGSKPGLNFKSSRDSKVSSPIPPSPTGSSAAAHAAAASAPSAGVSKSVLIVATFMFPFHKWLAAEHNKVLFTSAATNGAAIRRILDTARTLLISNRNVRKTKEHEFSRIEQPHVLDTCRAGEAGSQRELKANKQRRGAEGVQQDIDTDGELTQFECKKED